MHMETTFNEKFSLDYPTDQCNVKLYYIDLYMSKHSIPVYLNFNICHKMLVLNNFKIHTYIKELSEITTSKTYIIIFREQRNILSLYVKCNNNTKLLELLSGNIDTIIIYDGEDYECIGINNSLFIPLVDRVLYERYESPEYIRKQCTDIIIRTSHIIVDKCYSDARIRCKKGDKIVLNNTVAYFIQMIGHLYVLQLDAFIMCESMDTSDLINLLWIYRVTPAGVHKDIQDKNIFDEVWRDNKMGKIEICEYLTNVLKKRGQLIYM